MREQSTWTSWFRQVRSPAEDEVCSCPWGTMLNPLRPECEVYLTNYGRCQELIRLANPITLVSSRNIYKSLPTNHFSPTTSPAPILPLKGKGRDSWPFHTCFALPLVD